MEIRVHRLANVATDFSVIAKTYVNVKPVVFGVPRQIIVVRFCIKLNSK